jgi:hypothetical protein
MVSVLHRYLEDSSDQPLLQERLAANEFDGARRSRDANRDKVVEAVDRALSARNQLVSLSQRAAIKKIISAACHEEIIMELDTIKGQL